MTAWKHLRAILLLPAVMTVVIPATIVYRAGTDTFGLWQTAPSVRLIAAAVGLVSFGLGLALFAATNRLFAIVGRGTLAPWDPTQQLVVEGVYRHVRNPMISGVFCILLGEALLAASAALFCWFMLFVAINATFIPLVEERWLSRQFGAQYTQYRKHVPRWIPRLKPWDGAGPGERQGIL